MRQQNLLQLNDYQSRQLFISNDQIRGHARFVYIIFVDDIKEKREITANGGLVKTIATAIANSHVAKTIANEKTTFETSNL